jgi:hypothetical protein
MGQYAYIVDTGCNSKHVIPGTLKGIDEVVRHFNFGLSSQCTESSKADQKQDDDLEDSSNAIGADICISMQ